MAYNPNNPNGQAVSASSAPVVLASDQVNKEASFTGINATGAQASTDTGQYKWVSVHLTAGTSLNVSFQTSNDNTNWVTNSLFNPNTLGVVGTVTATGIYYGQIQGRYFRLLVNTTPTGLAGTVEFSFNPGSFIYNNTNQSFIGGSTIAAGNGVSGTGTQRVNIASDNTAFPISSISTSVTPGTAAANLGKAEDAAHTSGDTGVLNLGVRNDGAATVMTSTNGDYGSVSVDDKGRSIMAQKSTTAAQTSVAGSATSVSLLAANTLRTGATVFNDSTAILYLLLGTTASITAYTVQLGVNAYYEVPYGYVGAIAGIWASAAGSARIMEIS